MSDYLSGRKRNLNIGISSYTENNLVLDVIGNTNISGITTIGRVSINSSGIITSSNPGISTVVYYGDGSQLSGIGTFSVIIQDIVGTPVYPTFANSKGTTTIGISTDQFVFIPNNGYVGIGTTYPTSKFTVIGDGNFTGVVTASSFVGNLTGTATTAGIASVAQGLTGTPNLVVGVVTASSFVGNLTGTATTATSAEQLKNIRTFSITGDILAVPQNFDGTQNVSLASSIQPNSVGLGTHTYGDYVKNITGTPGQIEISFTSGEGVSPQISLPNNVNINTNLTVGQDVQINRNLNVNGNITIGGTTAYIIVNDFRVKDADIITGFTTNSNGDDVSTDITASHGGIAVASTEGSPLISLYDTSIGEVIPPTYKKIMWFKSGSFAGLNTDAWLINYGVGIGSTQIPNGVRLAVSGVQFTDFDISKISNINASGIITASNFVGNISGTATYATYAGIATYATNAGIATYASNAGIATYATNATNAGIATYATNAGISTYAINAGIATYSSYASNAGIATYATTAGIATYATNSGIATYSTTAGIATYATNAGIATYASNAGIATYATNAGISTYAINAGIATYATNAGIATYSTNAGIATNVIGGISSVTALIVSGISTLGTVRISSGIITATTGIVTYYGDGSKLVNISSSSIVGFSTYSDAAGVSTNVIGGISSVTALIVSGISTLGTIRISSGIITATTGIVTYYGDGSKLVNISSSSIVGFSTYSDAAGISSYSIISGYATTAGIATYSTNAGIATYASNAGIATYATNAGISTYATNAGISTYAINAGIATYSTNAGIATSVIGGISSVTALIVSGISTLGTVRISSGIITATTGIVTYYGDGSKLTNIDAGSISGNVTYANISGISTYSEVAGVTTALQNARTFQITGDIIASPISFNGTGNVSLAATIQPNSVALGTDTTGDYVQSISGTSNQITVTGGTGEASTPVLSIPTQFTAPQDVTVSRDLQVNRNLNVNGNITIGGTSATLFTTELKVADPDLVLGFRTDSFGNDISNDNTANHGGIAIASTEGSPLVQLFIAGIETAPATYKKIMWFKSGTFSGLGTDAWLSNYAVGIGSTQFPTGTRLAVGSVQFTERDLTTIRNINSTGIITASSFVGDLTGNVTGNFNSTGINTISVNSSLDALRITQTGTGNALLVEDSTNPDATPFVVSSNGFVGIGTITPIYTFDVAGNGGKIGYASTYVEIGVDNGRNIEIGVGATNISTFLDFKGSLTYTDHASRIIRNAGDNGNFDILNRGTGSLRLITQEAGSIDILTQNIFRHRINSDGVILVGTSASTGTASQPLQVTGGAYISGNLGIGTTNPTTALTVQGNVSVSGIITSTDYNSTSDIKLKENIQPIFNPVDKVLQLSGVTFDWKENGRSSMGVIAQEVEKVIPELVNGGSTKTVNYNGLIGLLIEVVKELKKEINNLKEKLN